MKTKTLFKMILAIVAAVVIAVVLKGAFTDYEQDTNLQGSKFFYPEASNVATSGRMTLISSTQIVASSTTFRTSAEICNTDATTVAYLSFDSDAIPVDGPYGRLLPASSCYKLDATNGLYQGAIRATSSKGSIVLTVNETSI